MSMISNVVVVKKAGMNWRKMKQVYDACKLANIDPPEEVSEFFEYGNPNEIIEQSVNYKTWHTEHGLYVDVKIEDIPKDVDILRFKHEW